MFELCRKPQVVAVEERDVPSAGCADSDVARRGGHSSRLFVAKKPYARIIFAEFSSMTLTELSDDASSMTSSSQSVNVWLCTEWIASATYFSPLWHGMMMETWDMAVLRYFLKRYVFSFISPKQKEIRINSFPFPLR